MRRVAVLLCLLLGSCGFQPLYGSGPRGPVAVALQSVSVAPIPERLGQLVRDGLERQLSGSQTAPFALVVTLDQTIEGFGIRQDESVSRERVSLVAHFALTDRATGASIVQGLARSDAAVDRVRSEYATITAERAAAQRNADQVVRQIITRLAQHFAQGPLASGPVPSPAK